MRDTVVKTWIELADAGHDLHFMTGDLGFKILDDLRHRHPNRFTNAGVAEANMITVAAGMAMTGKRVFCYSILPFVFMRAFEQIRVDLCSPILPVVVVGVGGGLSYGCEGHSHYAIEDLAIARSLPNLTTVAPGDPLETKAAVRAAVLRRGPTFIRIGRNGDPIIHKQAIDTIERGLLVRGGANSNITVFTTGHVLANACKAIDALKDKHGLSIRVISMPTVKPLDDETVITEAKRSKLIITIEEHSMIGGLGSAVAEVLFSAKYNGEFKKFALPDEYCNEIGDYQHVIRHYGLDSLSLEERIMCAAN